MKLIHDSTPCLLRLLLLAELLVHSSSRPTHDSSLCAVFRLMIHQVDSLTSISKKLHEMTDEEFLNLAGENRLRGLPHIQHTAAHFGSLKVNESLSQLFVFSQAFKLHVNWLKTIKDNFSLPSGSAEGASSHLLHLSNLLHTSLHQMREKLPESPSPSFPKVSTAFDVLQFSVEISEKLQVFCSWSKESYGTCRNKASAPDVERQPTTPRHSTVSLQGLGPAGTLAKSGASPPT